ESPLAMPSSILRSRWNCSSSSSSRSTRLPRRIDRNRKGSVNHQCSIRMALSLRNLDDLRNGRRETPPVRRLQFELPLSQARERIKFRPPVILGLLPLGGDPAFLFELVQCRVQGSLADLQHVSRNGFQAEADGPPVHGLQRQNFQKQQIQGALHEVVGFAHIGFREEYTDAPLGKQGESALIDSFFSGGKTGPACISALSFNP